jgi:cytoskeletal protein RodZ
MNDPNPENAFRAREAVTKPRLSRTVLRSAAPGYLLAFGAAALIVGAITWKIVRQSEAIHTAETRPLQVQAETDEPAGTPGPVLVELPADTATPEATTSHVTTTGALVLAPSAAPPPTVPVESLPPAAAPAEPAARATHASEPAAPHRAVPRKRPHHATPHPRTDNADDNENPYHAPPAPTEAPRAVPSAEDPDHLFDLRD